MSMIVIPVRETVVSETPKTVQISGTGGTKSIEISRIAGEPMEAVPLRYTVTYPVPMVIPENASAVAPLSKTTVPVPPV